MSFSGLNRSALNGGVTLAVAGATLITVAAGVSAQGLCTKFGASTFTEITVASSAPLRTARSAATASSTSTASAQWVIATSASAVANASLSIKASNTDAYAVMAMSGTGLGYIIRPGTGSAACVSTVIAAPTVTLGYASNIASQSDAAADASVKRSGQSTWQRDGYAQIVSASSAVSTALKTALPTAYSYAMSDTAASSIKTHGGAAALECLASVTATGSIDFAQANGFSDLYAAGQVTRYCNAMGTVECSLTAAATNTTQASAKIEIPALQVTADARLAARPSADIQFSLTCVSYPRTALIGNALASGTGTITADGVINRPGHAQCLAQLEVSAAWIVIRYGAVTFEQALGIEAIPITNPAVPAPEDRTVRVQSSFRMLTVPREVRTLKAL